MLSLALYISTSRASSQRSLHSDHVSPEHPVILIPDGKMPTRRYCKLGEQDAPGELILCDGAFLRGSVSLVIVGKPVVGLSSEFLGSHNSQRLIPDFLICYQFFSSHWRRGSRTLSFQSPHPTRSGLLSPSTCRFHRMCSSLDPA